MRKPLAPSAGLKGQPSTLGGSSNRPSKGVAGVASGAAAGTAAGAATRLAASRRWERGGSGGRAEALPQYRPAFVLALVLLHCALGVVMRHSSLAATLHSVFTLLLLFYVSCIGRRVDHIVYMLAYVVGCEVLWRFSNAPVMYEVAKYSVVGVSVLGILRSREARLSPLALLYFLFLTPAVLMTVLLVPMKATGSTEQDRGLVQMLAFNMSGPLALALAVMFFERVRLNRQQLMNALVALLAPTAAVGALTIYAIHSDHKVTFGRTSVSTIRIDYGPNQFSAAIGLGVLVIFVLFLLDERATIHRRVVMSLGMIALAAASALTFSRGGLYNVAGATVVMLFILAQDNRARLRLLMIGIALVLFASQVALPIVNNYTGGALLRRFQNTDTTGRGEIAQADLNIWRKNVVFGVGPGRAAIYRIWYGRNEVAHTEFTRMLAEHGLLGMGSLFFLVAIGWNSVRRAQGLQAKAFAAGCVAWSFLYMTNGAMRLAAPAFMIGLSSALCFLEEPRSQVEKRT